MNALQKLRQQIGEIRSAADPRRADAPWALVSRLLGHIGAGGAETGRFCEARDVEALDAYVSRLEHPASPATQPPTADVSAGSVTAEQMDSALRAFRKRLKVMRLADESKLGGRYVSGGRRSAIDAIMPPHEFPAEVWKALAASGKLVDTGQGFYSLPEGG